MLICGARLLHKVQTWPSHYSKLGHTRTLALNVIRKAPIGITPAGKKENNGRINIE